MASARTLALVGGETLLGREIRDLAATGGYPFDLRIISADAEQSGTLTSLGDEPAILGGLTADAMEGTSGLILAAGGEAGRQAIALAGPGARVIDLTGLAEDDPDARLRAPLAEPSGFEPQAVAAQVIAHPAAIAVAMLLRRLGTHHPIRRSVVQVFVPASERGNEGLDELHQQTIHLFAFKPLPKTVFDAQLAFNMLARCGEESAAPIEDLELRIERHLATLLSFGGEGAGVPMPSLRLAQAPVFHGYSFSLWVEFARNPGVGQIEDTLAVPGIDVRGGGSEPPSNVGQAGQGGIAVGAVAMDRNHTHACWLWMVADNLRLTAENALEVARQIP